MSYQPVTSGGVPLNKSQPDLAVAVIQGCNAAEKGYQVWIRDTKSNVSARIHAMPPEPGDVTRFIVDHPVEMVTKRDERIKLVGSVMHLLANRGVLHPDQEM